VRTNTGPVTELAPAAAAPASPLLPLALEPPFDALPPVPEAPPAELPFPELEAESPLPPPVVAAPLAADVPAAPDAPDAPDVAAAPAWFGLPLCPPVFAAGPGPAGELLWPHALLSNACSKLAAASPRPGCNSALDLVLDCGPIDHSIVGSAPDP
jgi:hypothetical protein